MKIWSLLVLASVLLLVAPVEAKRCGSSERFGGQLVRVGDSERRVLEVAGNPDAQRQLYNDEGAPAGYRLDYYRYQRTVQIYIRGGQVAQVCQIRE